MQNRRLASVMFADIAGYTSMMQENEPEALRKVKRFRTVLDEIVPAFGGEVIQYYGDGSLVIFQSAVKAVECGREIQLAVRSEPVVPLRIGIHIGDIVIDGENIYGNGVNIAARVESLGVPGAVLFTDRVIHDIQNHPDLEPVSRGMFHFKNVKEPTEVFALSGEGLLIPERKDMKGKLEPEKKEPEKSPLLSTSRMLPYISILALIVGVTGFSLKDLFFNKDTALTPLSLTVFVHGPGGKQDIVLDSKGQVIADFGTDRRVAEVGENGRTNFGEIPAKIAEKGAMLAIQSEGYALVSPDSIYQLNGEPVYLAIEPRAVTVTFKGQVLEDKTLEPVSGAMVMSEGVVVYTDTLGRFSMNLPKRQSEYMYKIIATKEGYQPLNERRTFVGASLEFRMYSD